MSYNLNQETLNLLVNKTNGDHTYDWEDLREMTGMDSYSVVTFRKGTFLIPFLHEAGLLNLEEVSKPTKIVKNNSFVSEIVKKAHAGEHMNQEDLLKLHNLKQGEFKIKSAKSSAWGNENDMRISSSITYEPENEVSFDDIERMYTKLTPKNLKPYKGKIKGDKVIEMIPADLHFNKVAFNDKGEEIWNTDIAAGVLTGYVEYMCTQGVANGADRCIFIWSNDFFNSESNGTTTHGTPQRNDKSPDRAFELGAELMIGVIEHLRSCFEYVDVIYIPSNHDKSMSFNLSCLLKQYFAKCSEVNFDNGTAYRKYRKFGVNVNGYTHDAVNYDRIKGAMVEEAQDMIGGSKERIFHAGHKHTLEIKEHNGSVTFLHPTGCPADEWHNEKVYLGHLKKFTASIYDKENGLENILFYKPSGVDF